MNKGKKTPIWDFYRSLEKEARGTKGRFVRFVGLMASMSDGTVRAHLPHEDWSPAVRDAILAAIGDGRWREPI